MFSAMIENKFLQSRAITKLLIKGKKKNFKRKPDPYVPMKKHDSLNYVE